MLWFKELEEPRSCSLLPCELALDGEAAVAGAET